MKTIRLLLIPLAVLYAANPLLLTAEDKIESILEKHASAMGADRRAKISTMIETRLVHNRSQTIIQIVYAKKPNKLRVEYLLPRGRVIRGFDGENTWSCMEKTGETKRYIELKPEEDEQLRASAITAIEGDLPAAMARAARIEIRTNEPVESGFVMLFITLSECEKLRLKLDRQTNLIAAIYTSQKGKAIKHTLTHYRQIDGIALPLESATSIDGEEQERTELSGLQVNVPLDDAFFTAPPKTTALPASRQE